MCLMLKANSCLLHLKLSTCQAIRSQVVITPPTFITSHTTIRHLIITIFLQMLIKCTDINPAPTTTLPLRHFRSIAITRHSQLSKERLFPIISIMKYLFSRVKPNNTLRKNLQKTTKIKWKKWWSNNMKTFISFIFKKRIKIEDYSIR